MYASTKQGNGETVRKQGNGESVRKRWEPYKGVYPDPTPDEYELILPFLEKYALEDDDFDEDADEEFVFLKQRFGCPHLRRLFIQFLRQVRESKGYDVTLGFPFIESPFFPKEKTEEGMDAALVAMEEINTLTIPSGKAYEFVSLDKYVWAYNRRYLLTIRAKENTNPNAMEIDEGDGADDGAQDDDLEKTIQAMVFEPYPDEYELVEWKFKADSSA